MLGYVQYYPTLHLKLKLHQRVTNFEVVFLFCVVTLLCMNIKTIDHSIVFTNECTLNINYSVFVATSVRRVAEVSYLVVCIFWSFHGCRICCLRQPWKYYENTNREKVRTLLARYTFIGFALLCFQAVTSCPLKAYFQYIW